MEASEAGAGNDAHHAAERQQWAYLVIGNLGRASQSRNKVENEEMVLLTLTWWVSAECCERDGRDERRRPGRASCAIRQGNKTKGDLGKRKERQQLAAGSPCAR